MAPKKQQNSPIKSNNQPDFANDFYLLQLDNMKLAKQFQEFKQIIQSIMQTINQLVNQQNSKQEIKQQTIFLEIDRKVDWSNRMEFRQNLTKEELANLIDIKTVEELESKFGQKYDEIVIRRCQAHGKFINFHLDVSLRTMQVAINGDEEYEGGKLLFICDGGKLVAPSRPQGTVTIHENNIVHGVTLLRKGIRYGLFFLRKSQN